MTSLLAGIKTLFAMLMYVVGGLAALVFAGFVLTTAVPYLWEKATYCDSLCQAKKTEAMRAEHERRKLELELSRSLLPDHTGRGQPPPSFQGLTGLGNGAAGPTVGRRPPQGQCNPCARGYAHKGDGPTPCWCSRI